MGASVRPEVPQRALRAPAAPAVDEAKMPPADLWDKKVAEGLPPDSATAYVARIHGAPPAQRKPLISNAPVAATDATASDRRVPANYYRDDLAGGLRTVEQGATLGFGDEINAGVRSLVHGEKLADALADERASVAGFRDRHPVGAFAGEMVGGLGAGELVGAGVKALRSGAAAVETASTPVRALKSVATGAAAGGAAAAGSAEGDVMDRLRAVPKGMAFGAGVAGAMNAGGAAVKAGGKALSNQASQETMVGRALRSTGVPTATDLAKSDVIRQLNRSGMSIDDAERAAQLASPDAMLLDVGGDALLRRTRGVHAIPSRGSEQIESALSDRVAGQPGRVQAKVAEGMNAGQPRDNAVIAAKKLIDARRTAAEPLYKAAYAAPPVEDPDVIATMNLPAFKRAHEIGRRIAATEGVELPPLTKTSEIGGKKIAEQLPQPVQSIDYMKRGLDDLIEGRMNSGKMGRTEARALRQRLDGLLQKVDETVSDYAKARSQFAGDSHLMEAHENGLNFLKSDRDELAAQWPTMTDGERELYRRGAMSQLSTELSKVADGRDVTRIFQNPLMREKLQTILPDQATANKFFTDLADEAKMHKNASFVRGGSPTARIEAEKSDALSDFAEPIMHAGMGNAGHAAGSVFKRLLSSEQRGLTEAQADAMAPYLTARGSDLAKVFGDLRQHGVSQSRWQGARSSVVRSTAQTAGATAGRRP